MNIAVIGTGYVGLVSGTCFAEMGNHVTCIDIDLGKIESLNQGKLTLYEPGLDSIFDRNRRQGRLSFTHCLKTGIDGAAVIFLALPTPQGADGAADLSSVLSVTHELSDLIDTYTVIVNKSTVPVGTEQKVTHVLSQTLDSALFDVVSNPEFLREGAAVQDFLKPERIVIGTQSDKAREIMRELYEPFVRQGNPIIYMDEVSAELTKYAANAYLATKITFMNEIANISELVGANVDFVRKALGADTRIGKRFLFPGVGFGGSCFPKDVHALKHTSDSVDYDFKVLSAVIDVNEKQRLKVFDKLSIHFNGNLKSKKITLWGLSFKPNTDDIREAPSLYTIDALLNEGVDITVYDPEAIENIKSKYQDKLSYAKDPYEALKDAEALGILTEWSVFRTPEYSKMKSAMKSPIVVDGRNVLDPNNMKKLGFTYYSIGRP